MPEQVSHRRSKGRIFTIQGYNGKNNKSKDVAATLATASVYRDKRNLLLQIIDYDYIGCENILLGGVAKDIGKTNERKQVLREHTVGDDGMDAIFCLIDKDRMKRTDFEHYCIPLITDKHNAERKVDIAKISKNSSFLKQAARKIDEVEAMVDAASNIYDNVFVLLSAQDTPLNQRVNEIADKSVYCLAQGNDIMAQTYGSQIVYVITEYEPTSYFTLTMERKYFCKNGEHIFKLSHNVGYRDAIKRALLFNFIRDNHVTDEDDVNYIWSRDVDAIMDYLIADAVKEQEFKLMKLFMGTHEKKDFGNKLETVSNVSVPYLYHERRGFFERLFGKRKGSRNPVIGIPDKQGNVFKSTGYDQYNDELEDEDSYIDTDFVEKQVDERRHVLTAEEENSDWGEAVDLEDVTKNSVDNTNVQEESDEATEIIQFAQDEKSPDELSTQTDEKKQNMPDDDVEEVWDDKQDKLQDDDGNEETWDDETDLVETWDDAPQKEPEKEPEKEVKAEPKKAAAKKTTPAKKSTAATAKKSAAVKKSTTTKKTTNTKETTSSEEISEETVEKKTTAKSAAGRTTKKASSSVKKAATKVEENETESKMQLSQPDAEHVEEKPKKTVDEKKKVPRKTAAKKATEKAEESAKTEEKTPAPKTVKRSSVSGTTKKKTENADENA